MLISTCLALERLGVKGNANATSSLTDHALVLFMPIC
jgi:hypothetical protein